MALNIYVLRSTERLADMAKKGLIKIVLATGKVVILRQMTVGDTETAAQQVAPRANGDANLLQLLMQKALVQLLVVKTADNETSELKTLTGNQKEDIDSIFELAEYGQVLQVIQKISGSDSISVGNVPKIEILADLA